MIKLAAKLLFFFSATGLYCSSICYGEIINGGLQNIGNTPPSAVKLNLVYATMNAAMDAVAEYVSNNSHCPPKNYFSSQTNNELSVSNGSACDVVLQFSRNVPGALQNKTIRMLVHSAGNYPTPIEFTARITITNIDYGSNGVDQTFLLKQAQPYTWSHTLQGSSFGNTASAPLNNVMNDSYNTITSSSTAANSTSAGSSGGAGKVSYTIG